MLPVGAFNFEPSPGDKARTSKLAPSVPLLPPSHGRTGKGGLPKGQALSAPAERTDWSSGSDPLQSKLERWCQLLDTAPGDIPPGTEQGAPAQGPSYRSYPHPSHEPEEECLPALRLSGPQEHHRVQMKTPATCSMYSL